MIPAPFDYVRAESVTQALEVLAQHGDEAKVLAGGQSLLPVLKLRLARPEVLVDIDRLADLRGVRIEDGEVVVGALTRHADVVRSEVLAREVPLLPHVARLVGDPQVRRRGTLGGSLVHADAAGDLPAAVLALGGTLVVQGAAGRRDVPATAFFLDHFETVVGQDELLVEVRLPRTGDAPWGYQKFTRRANDWAIVAAAAVDGRVALAGMGPTPMRASATEAALAAGSSAAQAAAVADEGTSPSEDVAASVPYRRHLARVLVERALHAAP